MAHRNFLLAGKTLAQVRKLQSRLDAAHEDKLDRNISEEFWQRKSQEWRSRQLYLSQQAYSFWLSQSQTEKRKRLNVLLLHCTCDGEKLSARIPATQEFRLAHKGPCVKITGCPPTVLWR